jgi:hypothetical protein
MRASTYGGVPYSRWNFGGKRSSGGLPFTRNPAASDRVRCLIHRRRDADPTLVRGGTYCPGFTDKASILGTAVR